MRKFFRYWLPVLVWAGLIFILSSIPHLESGLKQDFLLRKIAHILEYAILTFLLLRASGFKNSKSIVLAAIIAFLYALSDEYHQTFVLGRRGRVEDVIIDSIGILIASLVWYHWYQKTVTFRGRPHKYVTVIWLSFVSSFIYGILKIRGSRVGIKN